MDNQHEITWQMRQTLVDWLLQIHFRYHMWPETPWIAINVVDRGALQLDAHNQRSRQLRHPNKNSEVLDRGYAFELSVLAS
jgi:hypothetical protein